MGAIDSKDILFPVGGLHRGVGYQSQPPFTSVSCRNTRSRDTYNRMLRGGSRPQLVKAFPTQLGEIPSSGATVGSVVLTATKDAYIDSAATTTNYNTTVLGISSTLRSLIHFDLTSIPANSTITSAVLRFYVLAYGGVLPNAVTFSRITEAGWVEAEADWLEYSNGNAWASAGGDFTATGAFSTSITSAGYNSFIGANLVALCQDAYDNRSDQLHLMMTSSEETYFYSRSGTSPPDLTITYVTAGTVTAGDEIRLLAPCDSLNSEGTNVFSEAFEASLTNWTTDTNQLGTPLLPVVANGYGSTSTNVGLDYRSAVLNSVTTVDTGARRSISMKCVLPPAEGNQYIVGLDYSNTLGTDDGVRLVVENRSTTHSGTTASWALYVDGTLTESGTTGGTDATWIKLELSGNNSVIVAIGPTGNEVLHTSVLTSYTPAGTYARFQLIRAASSSIPVQVDTVRLEYISTAGGDPRNMLMASASGILYKQNLNADWTRVSSTVTLASDRMLRATRRLQKLYIADYGVLRSATGASSAGTTFTDSAVSNFSTGVTGLIAGDYIRIVDGTSVTVGDYRIQAVSSGSTLTMDRTAGAGASGITYKILRGPKVYDSATNQLTAMTPLTTLVPSGMTIVESWMDRLVWGGDPDFPHRAYMSKSGDPVGYDYSTFGTAGAAYPFSSTNSRAELGDRIRAIGSHRDDYLIVGGERGSYIGRGDPNLNGAQMDAIAKLGILDKAAWCQTPNGYWIAMTTDGLYRIPPAADATPEPMSRNKLPQELVGISTSLNDVQVLYDKDYNGVHIYVTPLDVGATTHWFYGLETDSFEPMIFATSDHDPTASCEFSMPGETPTVFLGCRDGYVRRFSDAAETDDGETMVSNELIGPIMLGGNGYSEGMIREVIGQLASASGTVTLKIRTGTSIESAYQATSRVIYTMRAGKGRTWRPNLRGNACFLELEATGRWALEQISIVRERLGKQRLLA